MKNQYTEEVLTDMVEEEQQRQAHSDGYIMYGGYNDDEKQDVEKYAMKDQAKQVLDGDDERNGIYALLSLSAAAETPNTKNGVGKGKRKVSSVPSSVEKKRKYEAGVRKGSPAKSPADGKQQQRKRYTTQHQMQMREDLPEWLQEMQRRLERIFSSPRVASFIIREFFYSDVDRLWFEGKNDDAEYTMASLCDDVFGLGKEQEGPRALELHRHEWWALRSLLGAQHVASGDENVVYRKPRRFSKKFLNESRADLYAYRDRVYASSQQILKVGQEVTAIHPKTLELEDGAILTMGERGTCRVQFDKVDLGVHLVALHHVASKPGPGPLASASTSVYLYNMMGMMQPMNMLVQQWNAIQHSQMKAPPGGEETVKQEEGDGRLKNGNNKERIGVEEPQQETVLERKPSALLRALKNSLWVPESESARIDAIVDEIFMSSAKTIEANKASMMEAGPSSSSSSSLCILTRPIAYSKDDIISSKARSLLQDAVSKRIKGSVKLLVTLSRASQNFDKVERLFSSS